MPKLKVDRIVSFSSEDSNHTAKNILLSDTTKKWKCQKAGEKSANIILQLEEASTISGIDIGNENSAYVEILVARSGSNDDFVVLLVMSSFMTPLEARQNININKVRMFSYKDFQHPERDQKWDRIKIVCTQPFNRHAQYGLSFITLHTREGKDLEQENEGVKLGNFTLRPSSPDNLTAGSLFARRKELERESPLSAAAAIRKASTSTSGNRSPKVNAKLIELKAKASTLDVSVSSNSGKERNRDQLLYNDEDEAPNSKIDQLIEQKNKETELRKEKAKQDEKNNKQKKEEAVVFHFDEPSTSKAPTVATSKRKVIEEWEIIKKTKLRHTKAFNKLLDNVTIVISGITNPERATIRKNALEMGAKYKGDWDDSCSHLVCAFTNTPKFRQVQGQGKIVNRLWISDCYNERKRLPWRRYALDSDDQSQPESDEEIFEEKSNSPDVNFIYMREGIEGSSSESSNLEIKSSNSVYDLDTDEEDYETSKRVITDDLIVLENFFDGKVLYVDQNLTRDIRQLLRRYIVAYKGLLLDEPSDIVDFVITSVVDVKDKVDVLRSLCPNAEIVSPDWIWECHNFKKLVSHDKFRL